MSADEQPVIAATETTAEASPAVVDAIRSEKILKAKELFSRGSRNYLLKSYAESADELSMVCELYQELYGELSDELGMPYLLYAKSLIALALDENKIIDVPDEEDDEDEEDDDDEDGGTAAAAADISLSENSTGVVGTSNSKSTNGETLKVVDETKAEPSTSASKCPEDDEADSTAEAVEEKVKSTVDAVPGEAEQSTVKSTDEAMVSSTEDGATAASVANKPKNGSVSNLTKVEKPTTSNGGAGAADCNVNEDEEENETASTLQLAWEILELAAKIFARQGLSGLPNLAEVQTELANIEFENNILDSARDDYEKALKIYSELPSNYRRAKAEIHYKIGLTFLMQQLNKEGAASLKEACNLIEDEIAELRAKEDPTEKDKNTIQDMEETKEEILVKISEIEEAQAQNLAEVRAALDKVISKPGGLENVGDGAKPSSSADVVAGASSSSTSSNAGAAISSSTKPTDISHLIKRKKPEPSSEAEAAEDSPAKRPAV